MKRSLGTFALFSALFAIVSLMVCSPAFAVGFETEIGKIADRMGKGETAAVSPIYEEKSGHITALGDRWRTRLEAALSNRGVVVKSRKDLGVIQDEIEMFGSGRRNILDHAGADVVVSGTYTIEYGSAKSGRKPMIRLVIKALRVTDGTVVKTVICRENLSSGWEQQASLKKGNIYHRSIEANGALPRMGMQSFDKTDEVPIRKKDVAIANNYLSEDEIRLLGLLVEQYLAFAVFERWNNYSVSKIQFVGHLVTS